MLLPPIPLQRQGDRRHIVLASLVSQLGQTLRVPFARQGAAVKAEQRVEKLQTKAAAARTAADGLIEQAGWEGKSNVRFVVLSRTAEELDGRTAYEQGYIPRGDAENRIKEQKYLFAGSLPCEAMRANQIRLYQCSFAYVLCMLLRRFGLAETELSQTQCPTIRTRLFKIGFSRGVPGIPDPGFAGDAPPRLADT